MTKDHNTAEPAMRRRAYSYLRFSTPEQRKGDSSRRQTSMALEYAARHGLDLDEELTFHDVGVSAFRGQNFEAGRLAHFLEAVQSGQVPQGSVLLVEQLDRISRLTPRKALRVLESIADAGVSVVTMNDGREYTSDSLDKDPMDLLVSILTFMRANSESETKANRLKAAWVGKRAKLAGGEPITARTPAWLRLSEDRKRFEVIEERAVLVRRIFDMTLDGTGQHSIASAFNVERISPWGSGRFWHKSYISKVLSNPAVVGTFYPHVMEYVEGRKVRRPLDPVEGYFPAIIPQKTFQQVQALRQAHGSPQRGRHAHGPVSHFLAGLAVCLECGSTMTRVAKGSRSKPVYVCSRAKVGAGCRYRSVRCDRIESALLHGLPERLHALEGAEGKDTGLVDAVEVAQGRISVLQEQIETLADNLSFERSPALAQRLRDKDAELAVAQETLRRLLERQNAATGKTVGVRVKRALEVIQAAKEGAASPGAVNLALRAIFKSAVIDWKTGEVRLEWTHGGTCSLHYPTFTKQPGPGWRWEDEEGTKNDRS